MDLMVDLETFDTASTAAIISIGAVVFDPETNHIEERTYHANVEWESALSYGTFSESTIDFWSNQSEDAVSALFSPEQIGLKEALEGFDKYVKSWKNKPKRIWANSPAFDVAILRHAFSKFDMKFPYVFWKEMDVRTIKNLLPKEVLPEREGVLHNAVDDCKHQCKIVQIIHGVEF